MTKKIEDFFQIPPMSEEAESASTEVVTKTKEELFSEAQQIYSSLTNAEKIDSALPTVNGLDTHDNEMDDIADKAVKTFDDLITLGANVPDMHAGKIFEVAGQMLKTALEAKNAKAEKKLRMIELQIKKMRVDQQDEDNPAASRSGNSGEFDRNELLKYIVSSKTEKSDK
jgi:hypothetical protein